MKSQDLAPKTATDADAYDRAPKCEHCGWALFEPLFEPDNRCVNPRCPEGKKNPIHADRRQPTPDADDGGTDADESRDAVARDDGGRDAG